VFLRDRQIPTRRWRLNCTTTDSSVLWLCSGCATHPRPTLTYLACFHPSALVHTMSFTYEAHRVQTCLIVWAVAVLWSLVCSECDTTTVDGVTMAQRRFSCAHHVTVSAMMAWSRSITGAVLSSPHPRWDALPAVNGRRCELQALL